MKRTIWASVTVGLAALMTFGCGNVISNNTGRANDSQVQFTPNQNAANPDKIWAVDTAGNFFFFFSDNPGAISTKITPTGLPGAEKLIAIDIRPRTGVLYGISTTGKLFIVNKSTGACTQVGTGVNPAQINADIDFNPTNDKLRQEADAQNIALNPNNGTLFAANTNLTLPGGAPANAVGCAYTNSFGDTATSTQLFVVTGASNRVYLQAVPANGQLTDVGQLPVDIGSNVGFDFSPSNVGYIASQKLSDSFSSLLRFDPAGGGSAIVSQIGGTPVKSIAVEMNGPAVTNFVAIDSTNRLVTFNSADPTVLQSSTLITGIAGGDTIVGCDFAPGGDVATGLKVLTVNGTVGKIYPVNLTTAVAGAPVAVAPALVAPSATLTYGVDISADGIMSVTAADATFSALGIISAQSTKSFRINVTTGAGSADADVKLNGVDATFVPALGFINNFQGAGALNALRGAEVTSSTDTPFARFLSIVPGTGIATRIGEMNYFPTRNCELDVDPAGNIWLCAERAIANTGSYAPDGVSTLHRVSPTTGGAVTVARIGASTPLKHFAAVPVLNAGLTTAP